MNGLQTHKYHDFKRDKQPTLGQNFDMNCDRRTVPNFGKGISPNIQPSQMFTEIKKKTTVNFNQAVMSLLG